MVTRKNVYLYDDKAVSFLESQQNQSKYIEDLIKKDMNKQYTQWSREDIIDLIEEYMKDKIIIEGNVDKNKDKDAIMSLQGLLNM